MNNEIRYLKIFYFLFLTGSTLLFSVSWFWNYSRARKTSVEYALIEARASYNKDLLYRRWASMHGGVYVPATDFTPPNPNLLFISERDFTSPEGKKYTLVNPAYMTRQVHEIAEKQYGVKGHITSLKPIRPQNRPDEWESAALLKFEKGETENHSIERMDSGIYLRYMKAMVTEQSCLKCHENQGYKLGDIRGGISVSVPMQKYNEVLEIERMNLTVSHLIIYFITLAVSFVFYSRLMKELKKRNEMQLKLMLNEKQLQDQNAEYARLNENYKIQNFELTLAKNRAEESDRLKTSFIQNISHEIRTPMNAIIGFSELLEDPGLSCSKRQKFVEIIINSTNQLLSIVQNILTISSLDKRQENITAEKFHINHLLEEMYAVFLQKARDKGIELECIVPENDSGRELFTDKTKLTQVLSNLISNALKFTTSGFIRFGYLVKNDILEFFVADSGIGIDHQNLEIIFERFRQADSTISRKFGGSGLGLSISKGFVEMLGGKIWVISEPGKGSEFRFTIPSCKM